MQLTEAEGEYGQSEDGRRAWLAGVAGELIWQAEEPMRGDFRDKGEAVIGKMAEIVVLWQAGECRD